jgi:serine/threonine-protein kinase RsbT
MIITVAAESYQILSRKDIVDVRKILALHAGKIGMNSMKENEFRTAATELLTNMIRYAGSGTVAIEQIEDHGQRGIRAIFQDEGPGIENIELALKKGYSTGKSLGLGLSGCKNLVDHFDLASEPGKGTRVEIRKWR